MKKIRHIAKESASGFERELQEELKDIQERLNYKVTEIQYRINDYWFCALVIYETNS
jgi:hypothetical protein